MKILSKDQSLRMFQQGLFGNAVRLWMNPTEFLSDLSFKGTRVSIRYNGINGGGPRQFKVPVHDIPYVVSCWVLRGYEYDRIIFNEDMYDIAWVQCEVMDLPGGLYLGYKEITSDQSLANRELNCLVGLQAKQYLMAHMDPSSYNDMWALFDEYPDSVIELTICHEQIGNIPGRNTIFFEVRNY